MGPLIELVRSQWFLPILAELGSNAMRGRAAVLRQRFALSHSMTRRTLTAMVEGGWIEPNPGHGHPLRPDYLLTDLGAALAPHAVRILEERRRTLLPLTGIGKWHLPLLVALGDGTARFAELEERLAPVTPRALSQQIKRSVDAKTVLRIIQPAYPPVALYRVNDEAMALRDRAVAIAAS